jgi:hypothetical protein
MSGNGANEPIMSMVCETKAYRFGTLKDISEFEYRPEDISQISGRNFSPAPSYWQADIGAQYRTPVGDARDQKSEGP